MPRFALFLVLLLAVPGAGLAQPATQQASKQMAAAAPQEDYTPIDTANKAIKAHQEGDLQRALELYTQVINAKAMDDGDHLLTYIYNNRGHILLTRNDAAGAIKDFDRAMANLPDATTLLNRGNAYAILGQDKRAIEDYNQALVLRPKYARAFANRGYSWLNLGEHAKAQADFAAARAIDPKVDHITRN